MLTSFVYLFITSPVPPHCDSMLILLVRLFYLRMLSFILFYHRLVHVRYILYYYHTYTSVVYLSITSPFLFRTVILRLLHVFVYSTIAYYLLLLFLLSSTRVCPRAFHFRLFSFHPHYFNSIRWFIYCVPPPSFAISILCLFIFRFAMFADPLLFSFSRS